MPTELLEYHIKNNQEAADLLESILHIDKFRDKYAKLPNSLEKTGFRSRPQDHKKCQPLPEEAHDFHMLQLAFTARVTTDLIIAHHALSHPRYPSLYSHEVAGIVEGVLQTDLSCTVVSDEPARIDQWRAELLRLYALMKLRDAGAIAELRGKESADESIKMGLDAAALGSEIIYPHARKDQASISASEASPSDKPTLFDRIWPTQSMDTLEEITLLRSQLLEARKDLAKVGHISGRRQAWRGFGNDRRCDNHERNGPKERKLERLVVHPILRQRGQNNTIDPAS